eukprot:g11092.t1
MCSTYREGAKMYADQKTFQQSAATRLKALELEHQELRRQINQELCQNQLKGEKEQQQVQYTPALSASGMPDLHQMPRAVNEILGTCSEIITSTARYIFDVVKSRDLNRKSPLKILSAADGCADDTIQEAQARYVPTSVMLAHAFAASTGGWIRQLSEELQFVVLVLVDLGAHACDDVKRSKGSTDLSRFCARIGLHIVLGDVCSDGVQTDWSGLSWMMRTVELGLLRAETLGIQSCREDHGQMAAADPRYALTLFENWDCIGVRTPFAWDDVHKQILEGFGGAVGGFGSGLVTCWDPFLEEDSSGLENEHGSILQRHAMIHLLLHLGVDVLAFDFDTFWFQDARAYLEEIADHKKADVLMTKHLDSDCLNMGLLYIRSSAQTAKWYTKYFAWLHLHPYEDEQRGMNALLGFTKQKARLAKLGIPRIARGQLGQAKRWQRALWRQLTEAVQMYNDRRAAAGGVPAHAACLLWRTAATQYWLQCDGIMLFQPGSCADPYRAYGAAALI